MVNSVIGTQTVSDHAPVSIDLQLIKPANRPWTRKLNESFIQEGQSQNNLTSELIGIFNENDTDEISPFTIWETHKCVMRGILIKKATEIRKNNQAAFQAQLNLVADSEIKHKKKNHFHNP